jgi:hypothetical protein
MKPLVRIMDNAVEIRTGHLRTQGRSIIANTSRFSDVVDISKQKGGLSPCVMLEDILVRQLYNSGFSQAKHSPSEVYERFNAHAILASHSAKRCRQIVSACSSPQRCII